MGIRDLRKPHEPVTPKHFGALGDGVTDDTASIQAAITYAKTLVNTLVSTDIRTTFGASVVVDGGGRTYKVSEPISMDGMGGVFLENMGLAADADAWTLGNPVLRLGLTNKLDTSDRYVGARNIVIECNRVADGCYAQNTRDAVVSGMLIHGMRPNGYGFRAFGDVGGACRFEGIRAFEWFFNEDDRSDYTKRTAIGISSERADNKWINCEGFYCKTPIQVLGNGSHIFVGSHPFNGSCDIPTWEITDAVAAPGGGTRFTISPAAGLPAGTLTTGDVVNITWVTGVSDAGGKPGTYEISVVDSTTVDMPDFAFSGTFEESEGWAPSFVRRDDEHVSLFIDKTATAVVFSASQFDSGKVVIENGASAVLSATITLRDGPSTRTALELVSDGDASASFDGISWHGNQHHFSAPITLTALNGGSIANTLRCSVSNWVRTDGFLAPALGRTVVADGSSSAPSLIFAGRGTADTENDESVTVDAGTGLYHPSEGYLGVSNNYTPTWVADDSNRLLVGSEETVAINGVNRRLQVHGGSAANGAAVVRWSNDASGPIIGIGKSRSATVGSIAGQTQSGDSLGEIMFHGDDGAGVLRGSARIRAVAAGAYTAANARTELVFGTASGASSVDRWKIDLNGNLAPVADATHDIGSTAARVKSAYAQAYVLVDGVTAPSTITGHASLYVDSADGDLKIKFADGTVKTIVTDT